MSAEKWRAVYKGDKFLCHGTVKECANFLNVSTKTIIFMGTPTYKKRMEKAKSKKEDYLISIIVDEIDEDEK